MDDLRELIDFDIEAKAEGHKSSEGDGRTAADIERENAEKAEEPES